MYEPRPQLTWLVKPDNNQLSVEVPSDHTKRLDEFLKKEEQNIKHIQKLMSEEPQKLDCSESARVQVVNTLPSLCSTMDWLSKNCPLIIFQMFNEELRSFKGFTTWMVFHSPRGLTIIDMQSLRGILESPKILTQQLKKIFMEERILKVGLNIEQQLLWLQRDFSVFTINVFDLRDALRYSQFPSNPYELSQVIFQENKQPAEKISELLRNGPMTTSVRDHIMLSTQIIGRILKEKPYIFEQLSGDCLQQVYRKINDKCRRSYHHHYDSQQQLQQLLTNKQNIFLQQEVIPCKPHEQHSTEKIGKLHRWRQQTAKMLDQSISYILPSKLLVELVRTQTRSILQLQLLYRGYDIHEVSRDHHHSILQILNEQVKPLNLQKMRQQVDDCLQGQNDHFKFLRQLGLSDPDWRNNDFEAMKMYKEIISMDTLCPSILEEELKVVEGRTLTNCQLMCIFNYARDWNKKQQIKKHYDQFKDKIIQNCQGCCCQSKAQNEQKTLIKNIRNPNSDQKTFPQPRSNVQILKDYQFLADKQRQQQDQKWRLLTKSSGKLTFNEKFPQTFSEIYQMANRRKKDIKKVKSKVQEKVQFIMPDTNKLYRDLGWA